MNHDNATTLIGLIVAATSAFAVDFSKLANGDHGEIAKAIFAVCSGVFVYLTNKKGAVS